MSSPQARGRRPLCTSGHRGHERNRPALKPGHRATWDPPTHGGAVSRTPPNPSAQGRPRCQRWHLILQMGKQRPHLHRPLATQSGSTCHEPLWQMGHCHPARSSVSLMKEERGEGGKEGWKGGSLENLGKLGKFLRANYAKKIKTLVFKSLGLSL